MSRKRYPLVNECIYHVLNRGVASSPIFNNKKDYQSLLERMVYYRNTNPLVRYSYFVNLPFERKLEVLANIERENSYLVDIISYCYMPNHWHLLLKQNIEDGISIYINRLSNSYARYFNTKHNRKGPMFQGRFKSVLIENDKQLLHTSRYIHLNPYSSKVVSSINELENYQFSSFSEYISQVGRRICKNEIILNNFKKINSYKSFILDRADYQRKLEKYKHLFIE